MNTLLHRLRLLAGGGLLLANLATVTVAADASPPPSGTQANQQAQAKPQTPPKPPSAYVVPLIGFIAAMLILVAGERDRLFGMTK